MFGSNVDVEDSLELDVTPYGSGLRRMRELRGLDQREVAAKLDVSPAYLSAVEHGAKPPLTPRKTAQLARVLGLTARDLRELAAARKESQLRFLLPAARLNPLQVQLANRFHAKLSRLTPGQIERIESELDHVPDVRGPSAPTT